MAELVGILKTVFFSNPDNFYKVLLVEIKSSDFDFIGEEITVTGIFGEMQEGEEYLFYGQLTTHYKYGEQFNCEKYEHLKPTSEESLIRYLSSDRFKGIGVKTAQNIVDILGLDAIDKINNDASVLEEVPRLTPKKRQMLALEIQANYGMEQMIFKLTELGLSNHLALQIYQIYQNEAINKLQENPYSLIFEVENYGFKTAEAIAQKYRFPCNDPKRIQAAILNTIFESCYASGDTYLNLDDTLAKSRTLLNQNFMEDITYDEVANQVLELIKDKKIYHVDKKISIATLYEAEESIASSIARLIDKKTKTFKKEEIEAAFLEIEKDINFTYDDTQKEAINLALNSSFFVLTGGPGTGKTTIINGVVRLYANLYGYSLDPKTYAKAEEFPIYLAAPTGRAAKRMSETTGLPAVTIHRLLGLTHGMDFDGTDVEFAKGLLIVDEFSMVDTKLASLLLEAVSGDMQVIFVGDKDQLPSVGPGQVLADLLMSKQIPCCELTKIYRQNDESSIIDLAHQVCIGDFNSTFTMNFSDRSYFNSDANHIEVMIKRIVESAKKKGYSPEDIQVLAPMYKGPAGIDKLNIMMQDLFNPKRPNKREIKHAKGCFRVGDKVLHLVNDAEANVFNGDMGIVVGIVLANESESETDELIVDFDGNEVVYPRNDFGKITLAYCCSIHKAQGSEFPVVILPMVSQYARQLMKRNLLYTGITRSKEKLIMLGEKAAFRYCVEHASDVRKTDLLAKINNILSPNEEVDEKVEYILTKELIDLEKIPVFIGMEDVNPYDFLDEDNKKESD